MLRAASELPTTPRGWLGRFGPYKDKTGEFKAPRSERTYLPPAFSPWKTSGDSRSGYSQMQFSRFAIVAVMRKSVHIPTGFCISVLDGLTAKSAISGALHVLIAFHCEPGTGNCGTQSRPPQGHERRAKGHALLFSCLTPNALSRGVSHTRPHCRGRMGRTHRNMLNRGARALFSPKHPG